MGGDPSAEISGISVGMMESVSIFDPNFGENADFGFYISGRVGGSIKVPKGPKAGLGKLTVDLGKSPGPVTDQRGNATETGFQVPGFGGTKKTKDDGTCGWEASIGPGLQTNFSESVTAVVSLREVLGSIRDFFRR